MKHVDTRTLPRSADKARTRTGILKIVRSHGGKGERECLPPSLTKPRNGAHVGTRRKPSAPRINELDRALVRAAFQKRARRQRFIDDVTRMGLSLADAKALWLRCQKSAGVRK